MIVKIHAGPERKVVLAVCDKELLGKRFEEGKIQLDLSSDFYFGKEMGEKEILKLFSGAYVINLVGERSIALGKKAGILLEENTIKIENIPYAQVILL